MFTLQRAVLVQIVEVHIDTQRVPVHSPAVSSVTIFMLSEARDNEVGGL
jgi:hypothetical protein